MNDDVLALLRHAGLAGADERPRAEALTGGVSSEIWRVELASGALCVKRALPRLRVVEVWEAPVSRNDYEARWLRFAASVVPGAAPRVLAQAEGILVMEYLAPERYPVWKSLLAAGQADPLFAAEVGRTLAAVHRASAGRAELAQRFRTDEIFHAIRLEPYLLATARRHPDLAPRLRALAERTASNRSALVHGDVSPKNILVGPRGPVFLDAECAWYGDPAFDLAFCLNHLLLKCLWVPRGRDAFLECFDALARGYLAGVDFDGLEERVACLLPALLLARVDGKSPVEYLTAEAQAHVRRFARRFIEAPPQALPTLRLAWQESLM